MSIERIQNELARVGLNLCAPLGLVEYEELVPPPWRAALSFPEARGVLVVGNGGRELWTLFCRSAEAELGVDPLDHYTRRVLSEVTGDRAAFALYNEQRDGAYLPLVALAQRAGMGTPGRIGLLLHPRFGPWMSLRAVVFVNVPVVTASRSLFDPCDGCPAPCAEACHGRAVRDHGLDPQVCYQARLELPPCALACDARRACVVGGEYTFSEEQEAHHARIRAPRPQRPSG